MEQDSRSRRCRRSVRNLRRSSGFLADSCRSALEIELPEAATNNLESTYGHIWLEEKNLERSISQLVTCSVEKPKHCAELDDSAASKFTGGYITVASLDIGHELAHKDSFCLKDFPSSQQSMVPGECLMQNEPVEDSTHCLHLASFSVIDTRIGNLWLQPSSQKLHSCIDVDFDEEPWPQTASTPVFGNIENSILHESDQPPSTIDLEANLTINNNFHEGVCNKENISLLKETTRNEVVENHESSLEFELDLLAKEEMNNALVVKQPIIDYISEAQDIISQLVRKETRNNDRYKKTSVEVKCSESEPKKRKRLSLKKIKVDTFVDKGIDVYEKCSETSTEITPSTTANDRMKKEDIKTSNVTYTMCTSQPVNVNQWSENQENIDFVNQMINKEIFEGVDLKDFHFLDFQTSINEKKGKKNAKALRRSSRYFTLHEMPLNDLSYDQTPDIGSCVSNSPKNDIPFPETSGSLVLSTSPKFSSCDGQEKCSYKNKENTPAVQLDATMKTWGLEDCSGDLLENVTKLENSDVMNVAVMEEVVEDFANLSVNEKARNDSNRRIRLPQKTKRRSSNRRLSGITDTTADFDIQFNKSEIFKDCKLNICSYDGSPDEYIPQGPTNSPENLSEETTESCYAEISVVNRREIITDGQTCNNSVTSASAADIDTIELPSLVNFSAEDEMQANVISGYKKSMRIRRSRKSWDTSQNSTSDIKKKSLRREKRQSNTENKSVQPLMSVSAHSSAPMDVVSDQLKDSDDFSEVCKTWKEKDDEECVISPGLLSLYRNKNFVRPQPRSWETIKESPKFNQPLFSKQRHKCFLEFENGITRAKLQRRRKKALEIYKNSGEQPTAVTDDEFGMKMLDVQLFLDS